MCMRYIFNRDQRDQIESNQHQISCKYIVISQYISDLERVLNLENCAKQSRPEHFKIHTVIEALLATQLHYKNVAFNMGITLKELEKKCDRLEQDVMINVGKDERRSYERGVSADIYAEGYISRYQLEKKLEGNLVKKANNKTTIKEKL